MYMHPFLKSSHDYPMTIPGVSPKMILHAYVSSSYEWCRIDYIIDWDQPRTVLVLVLMNKSYPTAIYK